MRHPWKNLHFLSRFRDKRGNRKRRSSKSHDCHTKYVASIQERKKRSGLHLGVGMDGLMVGAEVGADGDIGNGGDDGSIAGCSNGGETGGGSWRKRETSCAKRRQSAWTMLDIHIIVLCYFLGSLLLLLPLRFLILLSSSSSPSS